MGPESKRLLLINNKDFFFRKCKLQNITYLEVLTLMKKITAILLMGVLLLNWFGYRLVADYFENRASNEMQAQLDIDNYSDVELISIKVPLSIPYGPNSQNFEKVEGNIDINGINYQYVKRRFYKDTLELMCIPNTATTNIKNAREEFSKLANDFVNLSTSKKLPNSHNHSVKYSIQDFTSDHYFDIHQVLLSINPIHSLSAYPENCFIYLQKLDKPPEA